MIKERVMSVKEEKFRRVVSCLPLGLCRELWEISRSVPGLCEDISELRLRAGGLSSITVGRAWYPLFYRVSQAEVAGIFSLLTEGAPYLHRETLARGYISAFGVRVGVSGEARGGGGEVAVGEVVSLVFRLGGAVCGFASSLGAKWRELGCPNLLIAAPPLGGKTTALRALAKYIGTGRDAMRVVVADERCEFDTGEYKDATVDVLRGYRRAVGIELAYRTMAAEVIIADEIANKEEAEALLAADGAGVRLISSVHAGSAREVLSRECIGELISRGSFRWVAFISGGAERTYEMRELSEL